MTMAHEQVSLLLGAYALDAVDADERAEVARHLLTCAQCRAEVEEHREVAALLANPGSDAPAGLWGRIAGSLDEPPPALGLAPVSSPPTSPRWWPRRAAPFVALVAAASVAIAGLGVQLHRQGQRIDRLQTAAAHPFAAAYDRALADPASRVVDLAGAVELRAVLAADGRGYLRAAALPRLATDRTYQLWGQVGDDLVSLGVLGADPDVVSFPAASVRLLAVTVERAGGVVRPSATPIVTGTVPA